MSQNIKKIIIPALIAVICLFSGWFIFYFYQTNNELGPDEAAAKAVEFINENFLSDENEASLISVNGLGSVYQMVFNIRGTEYTSYVSKDGKLLFPEGYSMEKEDEGIGSETPKQDIPDVDLFVMSFCPYGNLAENTMLPVYNLLKDKVNWNIHYIVSANGDNINSLHGQPEVDQNEREVCVLQNSGLDEWWRFTIYINDNCGSDGLCWQKAAADVGLDIQAIENCVSLKGFSLMQEEAVVAEEAGATGSPTMLINGVGTNSVYQYGDPQVYLEAICSGFNSVPEECSQELSAIDLGSASEGSCE
ncbi:MAG: hypothetical protein ABIA08_01825 [bacterium]